MIVSTLLLRSMAKARYENQRASHFGLALEYYTHFTSPIRRYADLYIHRIFKSFVKNRLYFDGIDNKLKSIEKICDHISFTERRADEAEREVEKLLKVILMEGKNRRSFRRCNQFNDFFRIICRARKYCGRPN